MVAIVFATAFGTSQAFSADRLLGFEAASRVGLERAWFSQVRVDRARNRVIDWTLDHEQIFALTSAGTIHAINTRSGKTLWVSEAGRPDRPSAGLAVDAEHVALVNGSTLYVLDRGDGHLLWSREIGNVALTVPAISETHVFIAQMGGRVEGFSLEDPTLPSWQYQSMGHIFLPPLVTGDFITWATDRGQIYFGITSGPTVLLRVETHDKIVSSPTVRGDKLYATSLGGYVYCYDQASGAELWRYSTGLPIISPPSAIGSRVYVATESSVLHAVDSTEGRRLWSASGVAQFVAQGAHHVYGLDRFGTLLVLDSESGKVVNRVGAGAGFSALANDQSDRLYLVSESGLVQCLHEIGAREPKLYPQMAAEEKMKESKKKGAVAEESPEGPATEEPAEDDNPFDDGENPF